MRILSRFVLYVMLLASPVFVAQARSLTNAEKQKLETTVVDFNKAMRTGDYDIITKTIPPRLMEFYAKQANIDVDTLRGVMADLTKASMALVKIEDFDMDFSAAATHELPNGEPYALIPMETVTGSGLTDNKMVVRGDTLAMLDSDNWYLVRVSEAQQIAILRQVYPEFASVEFSSETMEAVK